MSKILSFLFAKLAYRILLTTRWKYRTVAANLRHILDSGFELDFDEKNQASLSSEIETLYKAILKNLTRHVGEMLFQFNMYKNLPEDTASYPIKHNGKIFELAPDAAPVIGKMRKGGIFLTAHYGNYEASGAWLCALGAPLKASFIPLKPTWLNRIVYEKIRAVKGRPYSIHAQSPREFLRSLDSGELFCLLADQDSRISSALHDKFLGQPANVNPVPDFLLKHRPDTPLFFCWIEEESDKRILHATEVPAHCFHSYAEPYHQYLETRIKENPALWYGWTHRRFFSRNPEIYH